jgi:hypothetical protein
MSNGKDEFESSVINHSRLTCGIHIAGSLPLLKGHSHQVSMVEAEVVGYNSLFYIL